VTQRRQVEIGSRERHVARVPAREADPDREIYDLRLRLLMAGRCEDERRDQ